MTEQEQKDLDDMKRRVEEAKISFFDYASHIVRWSPQDLLTSGYRNMSNAEALHKAFKDAQKKVERLHNDYIAKYPD